jgi:hypothetical protein
MGLLATLNRKAFDRHQVFSVDCKKNVTEAMIVSIIHHRTLDRGFSKYGRP